MENEQKPTSREKWESRQQKKLEEQTSRSRMKSIKKTGVFFAIIIGVFGAGFLITNVLRAIPSTGQGTASLVDAVTAQDHSKGNENAPVTIVEYSDFQCPACGYYYPLIKEVLERSGDSVRFVYRHFPLKSIHPKAELASLAAEAAGLQGKFWEMHDMIFDHQTTWSQARNAKELFIGYANTLGLDTQKFEQDLESSALQDKVDNDVTSGFASGVQGTPTFFLNGELIKNPQSVEEFESYIAAALDAQADN